MRHSQAYTELMCMAGVGSLRLGKTPILLSCYLPSRYQRHSQLLPVHAITILRDEVAMADAIPGP